LEQQEAPNSNSKEKEDTLSFYRFSRKMPFWGCGAGSNGVAIACIFGCFVENEVKK
jgi:hypothetical protein